jgi:hypothetical protein
MCRKILMHLAVDKVGAKAGAQFAGYVDALEKSGYVTQGLKTVVDQTRKRGNVANHELPSSSEQESVTTLTITEHLLAAMYSCPVWRLPRAYARRAAARDPMKVSADRRQMRQDA